MNLYYFCVYLSFAVAGTPYSEISPIFLHFFPGKRGFLFLASSAAVLFWHSLLSLDVFLVFPYFSRCCLLLHTTKLVYPFLLSNISGFSRVFSGCTGTSKELAEENAAGKSGGRGQLSTSDNFSCCCQFFFLRNLTPRSSLVFPPSCVAFLVFICAVSLRFFLAFLAAPAVAEEKMVLITYTQRGMSRNSRLADIGQLICAPH